MEGDSDSTNPTAGVPSDEGGEKELPVFSFGRQGHMGTGSAGSSSEVDEGSDSSFSSENSDAEAGFEVMGHAGGWA